MLRGLEALCGGRMFSEPHLCRPLCRGGLRDLGGGETGLSRPCAHANPLYTELGATPGVGTVSESLTLFSVPPENAAVSPKTQLHGPAIAINVLSLKSQSVCLCASLWLWASEGLATHSIPGLQK